MTATPVSTRRSFIRTAGTALSAPLAAVAVTTPLGAVQEVDPLTARLARLEDECAIRALNQAYARHLNAGASEAMAALFADASDARVDTSLRSVSADGFGEQDAIDVAADRQTATARVYCVVEADTVIGPSCPLVEMAREQGGGVVTRTEHGVFENAYVRRDGIWRLQRSAYVGRQERHTTNQDVPAEG
jgi:hypothetical protein